MALNDSELYEDTFDNVEEPENRSSVTSWPDVRTLSQQKPDVFIALLKAIRERQVITRSLDSSLDSMVTAVSYGMPTVSKGQYYNQAAAVFSNVLRWLAALVPRFVNLDFDYVGQDLGHRLETYWDEDKEEYVSVVKKNTGGHGIHNFYKMWTWSEMMNTEGCSISEFPIPGQYITQKEFLDKADEFYKAAKNILSKLYATDYNSLMEKDGHRISFNGYSNNTEGVTSTPIKAKEFTNVASAWGEAVANAKVNDQKSKKSAENDIANGTSSFAKAYIDGILGTYDDDVLHYHADGFGIKFIDIKSKYKDSEGKDKYDQITPGSIKTHSNSFTYEGRWSLSVDYDGENTEDPKAVASISGGGRLADFLVAPLTEDGQAPIMRYRVKWNCTEWDELQTKVKWTYSDAEKHRHDGKDYYTTTASTPTVLVAYKGIAPNPAAWSAHSIQLRPDGKVPGYFSLGVTSIGDLDNLPQPPALPTGSTVSCTYKYTEYDENEGKRVQKEKTVSAVVVSSSARVAWRVYTYGTHLDYSRVLKFT